VLPLDGGDPVPVPLPYGAEPSGSARPSHSACVKPGPVPSSSVMPRPVETRTAKFYMAHGNTPAQNEAVASALGGLAVVERFEFEDRQVAFARFKEIFCDAPDLVAATRADNFPEVFVVSLRDPDDLPVLQHAVESLPGVGEVMLVAR
jgi:hypothetical protein